MEFVKRYAYVFLGVLCVMALGVLFMLGRDRPAGVVDAGRPIAEVQATANTEPDVATPPPQATAEPEVTDTADEPVMIAVHVVGAVYSPGFIWVPYGSRVYEVVQLAGGATEDADLALINIAAVVRDAEQIRVPFIGDDPLEFAAANQPDNATGGSGGSHSGQTTGDGRININLASFAELQTLTGIGEVRARNIIAFREANNGFNSIYELLEVSQIGDGIFAGIRDYVTVE